MDMTNCFGKLLKYYINCKISACVYVCVCGDPTLVGSMCVCGDLALAGSMCVCGDLALVGSVCISVHVW